MPTARVHFSRQSSASLKTLSAPTTSTASNQAVISVVVAWVVAMLQVLDTFTPVFPHSLDESFTPQTIRFSNITKMMEDRLNHITTYPLFLYFCSMVPTVLGLAGAH